MVVRSTSSSTGDKRAGAFRASTGHDSTISAPTSTSQRPDNLVRSQNRFRFNLRSFHLEDESFARRERPSGTNNANGSRHQYQTAAEIFGTSNNSLHSVDESSFEATKTKTGIVDGNEVCFEWRENVTTSRPTTPRKERISRQYEHYHLDRSPWEVRIRIHMIQKSLSEVTLLYLLSFLALNLIFAGIFYIHPDTCCDDPDLTYAQVLDFTIQTSTTIGYGGYVPHGLYANAFVFALSYTVVLLNTVLAGLLFLKFTTPTASIQFSDVMTYCNVNGLPCLQIRVANGDGPHNLLTDVTARLTHLYTIQYCNGYSGRGRGEGEDVQQFGQTQELVLLNSHRDHLSEVWTLKHVIDESSPLFGLNFDEYPGSSIMSFNLSINAIQDATKSPITAHTGYELQDVMIGHGFEDQIAWDNETKIVMIDHSKLSNTKPSPAWYPRRTRV